MNEDLKYLHQIASDNEGMKDKILPKVSNVVHIDNTCILFNINNNNNNYLKYCFNQNSFEKKLEPNGQIDQMIKRGINHHYNLTDLPNVQKIFNPSYHQDITGLIGPLESIPGRNLNRKNNESIDPDLIINQFKTLENTVSKFHEREIMHKDIKPGNIIQDRSDNVYLIDFSTATTFEEDCIDKKNGVVFGTIRYLYIDNDKSKDFVALALTFAERLIGKDYDWGFLPNKRNIDSISFEFEKRLKRKSLYESADFFSYLINKEPEYDSDNLEIDTSKIISTSEYSETYYFI